MFCQRVIIVFNIFLSLMFLCVSSGQLPTDDPALLENKKNLKPEPNIPLNNVPVLNNLEGPSEGNNLLNSHIPVATGDSLNSSLTEPAAPNNPAGTTASVNGAILPSSNGTTVAHVDSTSHSTSEHTPTTELPKEHHLQTNATTGSAPVPTTAGSHSEPPTTQKPPGGSAAISSAALSLIILGSTIASIL